MPKSSLRLASRPSLASASCLSLIPLDSTSYARSLIQPYTLVKVDVNVQHQADAPPQLQRFSTRLSFVNFAPASPWSISNVNPSPASLMVDLCAACLDLDFVGGFGLGRGDRQTRKRPTPHRAEPGKANAISRDQATSATSTSSRTPDAAGATKRAGNIRTAAPDRIHASAASRSPGEIPSTEAPSQRRKAQPRRRESCPGQNAPPRDSRPQPQEQGRGARARPPDRGSEGSEAKAIEHQPNAAETAAATGAPEQGAIAIKSNQRASIDGARGRTEGETRPQSVTLRVFIHQSMLDRRP